MLVWTFHAIMALFKFITIMAYMLGIFLFVVYAMTFLQQVVAR